MAGSHILTPIQGGMLFQNLLARGAPERSGFDVEQLCVSSGELLDPEHLRAACNDLGARHPVLCSHIRWRDVGQPPRQIYSGALPIPFELLDWRASHPKEQRASFLRRDRAQGFALDQPPLMRFALALLPDGSCELFWTIHHVLVDGRNFAPLLQELFVLYRARAQGAPAPAERAGSANLSDYVEWLQHQPTEAAYQYFQELLRGKSAPTPLPLAESAARPLSRHGYANTVRSIEPHLLQDLENLAARCGTTLGGVLQCAWALLLYRLTSDADVVFGVTRSCRYALPDGAGRDIVGPLINTLPVRIAIDEQESVAGLLGAVRRQMLEQRGMEHLSLQDVQTHAGMGAGVALFESLLMFDRSDLDEQLRALDDAWNERHCEVLEQPSTPLTLIATHGSHLKLQLLHDRRRYADGVASRILDALQCVLRSLPHAERVCDVQILSAQERRRLIHDWNDTAHVFSGERLIHQDFEAAVDRQPTAIAVESAGTLCTYAQLELRANRIANALLARGIGPHSFVGVCLARGVDLVAALLGVAKSGAAYVPLDPEYPAERLAFMLEDCGATIVLTEPEIAEAVGTRALLVSGSEVQGAATQRPAARATSDQCCYVIYTSGSTGRPKGVVLNHRAVMNTVEWVTRTFGVDPGDRLLWVTSHCFDLSVYDVFGVLGAGGTVVVATAEALREPRELVRMLVEERITIWDSAPAALQRLVPLLPDEGGTALRLVMLSGDWIPVTLPDALRECFAAARVVSLGGATEAAIWSNWYDIDAVDERWASIPYGRPIQNAQYYILDASRRPVPVGVTGNLYISGSCLAAGYWNRAELTAERFVANPFRPGERMYMTGDLARHYADGDIEFLGRCDFQVKIRGFRVELGEVESALRAIDGVGEALCTAFTDVSGARALAAYVTPRGPIPLDPAQLRQRLRCTLPDFMVPACLQILDAMPVSANGKVDRAALPSPLRDTADSEHVEPQGEAEIRMACIWSKLLKRPRVGAHDNFFALGGDSLLAVALVVEIARGFGVDFPLARVMEQPLLRDMTRSLLSNAAPGKHMVALNARGTKPPMFLFCGVGGFGFFFNGLAQQLGPDQPLYVLHAIGADDASERVDHSIEEMVRIYESEILEVCPEGPLVVGGYSFGTMIAYEVARQLLRRGREIPMIVSFDGPAPGHPRLLPLMRRIRTHMRAWWRQDARGRRDYLLGRLINVRRRFQRLENDPSLTPEALDPVLRKRLGKVTAGLWRARDGYHPDEQIDCDLLLLKAQIPLQWPGCETDEVYGWREYLRGRIRVVELPGSHLQFFGPGNDATMAQLISAAMAGAQALNVLNDWVQYG